MGRVSPIHGLLKQAATYLPEAELGKVKRAWLFGQKVHRGQQRASGVPYIYHPIEVAHILAKMHLDQSTLIAALLHDVIEDTKTSKEEIAKKFGQEVAELVDGVSKILHISFSDTDKAQSFYFRKMLMAMSNDIRVILIKLADRLHNMETLGALLPEKRRRIARETLEIYAPIAQRIGMNIFRLRLEDLAFSTLYPVRYRVLNSELAKARGNRKEIVEKIKQTLRHHLIQEALHADVIGREKHRYGIYQKMRKKSLSFSEVHDLYAFRIIVDSVDECYRTLGIIHGLYKPKPGAFKDYIAIPKVNGYQSLHSVLFGPYRVPIEVQIRTKEMDEVAEDGIAAHWLYKSAGSAGGDHSHAHKRVHDWLRGILNLHKHAGNPQELLENVRIDLIPDYIYVFTPNGKILELPHGSSAVDFAYTIHTDIGNCCVRVKIDHRPAPLSTRLVTGQTVEIFTDPVAHPWPNWLDFVVTPRARTSIRHYLHRLNENQAISFGKQLLQETLRSFPLSLEEIDPATMQAVLNELKLPTVEKLFHDIGLGNQIPLGVVQKLLPNTPAHHDSKNPLLIKGVEGNVVHFPKCCYPIPGDPIQGYVSTGRGIVVHRQGCKNTIDVQKHPERSIDVAWEQGISIPFPVQINLETTNKRGMLATIASSVADQNINIINVDIRDKEDQCCALRFVVEVKNRGELAHLLRYLHNVKGISHIARG